MKIVINKCYGGWRLSEECEKALGYEKNQSCFSVDQLRTNKELIRLMETRGTFWCSGFCSRLAVVDIPDNIEYEIYNYDGSESIHEKHRVWR